MKLAGIELAFRPLDNLNLKVISAVLALGLWNLVPDPSTPHLVRGVPVQLDGIPSDLALAEPFNVTLDVLVRGATVRARELVPGELSPRVDLLGAHAGQNSVALAPGDIPAPFGMTVQSLEPSRISVYLEHKVRAVRPVNVVVEGSPAQGFEVKESVAEPAQVTIVGPASRVEGLDGVSTEVISVAGQRQSLSRTVAVLTEDPLVQIDGPRSVRLTLVIEEVPVTAQIEDVPVRVVNGSRRVAINPELIGVVLRGPPSLLATLTADNIVVELDVADLEPREADYSVEPRIGFAPADLAERLEVLALTPQRRLDVHVFPGSR